MNEIESVRQARHSVSLIRKRLLRPVPEALEACGPLLYNAIDLIAWLQHRLQSAAGERVSRKLLLAEIAGLRRELSQTTSLMRGAAGFYGGLARLLNPTEDYSTGYARNGAVSLRNSPTLRLEG